MTSRRITDPRKGRPASTCALADEFGTSAHIIWYRFDTLGIRSMTLFAPKDCEIDIELEHQLSEQIWRRSLAGIVSTHRLADVGRAWRQQAA